MLPVLFSAGAVTVSSFGVFLALAFLAGIFIVWRLCRAWDLPEEKILDLALLTFIGGLVGARLYFAIDHFSLFAASPLNIIMVNKIPGFSFNGGFLGGWLTLFFAARRFRLDFRQLSDIALVGLLGGLILTDFGCFQGGCNVGITTSSFLGVNMAGFIGKRWPVQLFEAFLLSLVFMKIWAKATHFHQRGKIVSISFIYIGLVKLMLLPFKQNNLEILSAFFLIFLGLTLYYVIIKQSPLAHLAAAGKFLTGLMNSSAVRKETVQRIGKYWYNKKTNFGWNLRNIRKLLRRSNVKFS